MGEHAPIGRDALEDVLQPLGRARALPGKAYMSEELFAWELEHFFGGWSCVGWAADIAREGDRLAARAGGESFLLVRDGDGATRAYFNVCRHRGHELLTCGERAHARVLKCPYHSWVYGLDGSLKGAPGYSEEDGFERGEHGLAAARFESWAGWLFVDPSGAAPAFDEHVGDLAMHVKPYGTENLVVAAEHVYTAEANWKLIVENYHECYHCSSIHPELCRVTPPDSGESFVPDGNWAGGSMELVEGAETMSLDGRSGGVALPGVDPRVVLYLELFPNLLVSLHPDYVMTHRLEPLAVDRTRIECRWAFAPEAVGAPGFDPSYAAGIWDIVNRQDWAACESVQRGVASRAYVPGPLSHRESSLHRFIALVANSYREGAVARPTAL